MTPQKASSAPLLSPVLVVGGCGFLGYHLVRHLLADSESGDVHVVDRDISKNLHGNATYVSGSITDGELLHSLVSEIKPRVIFHMASPMASLPASREGEFLETNIKGTEVLLTLAAGSEWVQAFVYTSSVDIYTDPPYVDVAESHALWPASDKSNEYNRTKAIADRLVREANGPQLRTITLRLGHAYGERHIQGMVETLDMCEGGKKLVQVGPGENLMEVVSADNSSIAHLVAAKALLDPSRAAGKVDGEGFNISDGVPMPFWHHIKLIWKTALGQEELKNLTILPAWVMIVAVNVAEWVFWIFTFNMVKPPVELRRISLEYCIKTHTYNIDKARKRLGFEPVSDHDAVLMESVKWMLRHREALKKTK